MVSIIETKFTFISLNLLRLFESLKINLFKFIRKLKIKFTYWIEKDGKYLGYLNDYPDHWTQGDTLEDLIEYLKDLYLEFTSGEIPGIKKVSEIDFG